MPWAGENNYDAFIASAAAKAQLKHGVAVPVPLVKAVIAVESGFKPTAFRNEPKINDASRGLMQVLYSTALGTGWNGTTAQLMDPATNINVGVDYLGGLLKRKGGDMLAAVSAYNNGHGNRATKDTTTCLARDQVSGDCIKSYTAHVGQFLNQPHVDKVSAALEYFDGGLGVTPGGANLFTVVALGGALWWAMRRR